MLKYSFYLDPMADIAAKFEVICVVQHKKIGSQQKQKRKAKSNNTDCHLQDLCCHIFSIPLCFRNKAQEGKVLWTAFALPTVPYEPDSQSFKQIICPAHAN